MKKIKEKMSFFTKIFLALGLLFTNLSSLSVVFAYTEEKAFSLSINEDKKVVISYPEEIEESDVIKASINENYTYLDSSNEENNLVINNITFTEGKYLFDSEILSKTKFDGLYEITVALYKNDTLVDTVNISSNIVNPQGLSIKVYDSNTSAEISNIDGVYNVPSKVKIVSTILSGGLNPNDSFYVGTDIYQAKDLILKTFEEEVELNYKLAGEYNHLVSVTVKDINNQEKVFTTDVKLKLDSYSDNDNKLNDILKDILKDDRYHFTGNSKEGILLVKTNNQHPYTLLDLQDLLDKAEIAFDSKIKLKNNNIEDVMLAYIEYLNSFTSEEDSPMELNEFLDTINIDDSLVITISNQDLEVNYKVILVGDMNQDGIISQEDLQELINSSINDSEIDNKKDINNDTKIDILDVAILNKVLNENIWNSSLKEEIVDIDAQLRVMAEDIKSGDEFTIDYVLTLDKYSVSEIAGLIDYDKEKLSLISITANNDYIGNNQDGKFLYAGSLLEGTIDEETLIPEEYTVLTLTFKSLSSGKSIVKIKDAEFANQDNYYVMSQNEYSTEVNVNKSTDNTLGSLEISGVKVDLEQNKLKYTITVDNDVTSSDVVATANNIAASITSIEAPEELVVGENKILITVESETGDEKIYEIIVIREEKQETTPTTVNYQEDNTTKEEDTKEEIIVDTNEKKENKEEVKDTENNNISRIIIIILILLVIVGLIYLIFKDDDDETKKANKDINKLAKEKDFTNENKKNDNKKTNSKKETPKKSNTKNNKKER